MENDKQAPEQEVDQSQETTDNQQPGWFQEFVDHYDVDKPKQGEMLTGTILDIQPGSILLDVGLKRDAIIPGQDLDRVDDEILENLSVGDEITVGVIRTPLGDDDLLVSLQKGLAQKSWVKAQEVLESDEMVELEIVDQNRGGLLVAYDNLRGFVPNSHIPSIRRGTGSKKAGEIKGEMIGDTLSVKAIEVNPQERRLVFSARGAQKDQRQERLEELEVGEVIKSKVVNVVDFGLFVDLHGVDGLVHKSEIDWEHVNHPSDWFSMGDDIEVKIVSIDKERERVSLSRKVLQPNPWQKLADKFQEGDLVEGVVVSVLDFGAFVEIQEGLQGLVHVSELGYANPEDPKAVVRKGDVVLVKILGIEPERERVSLSMRRVPVAEQMEWIMNLEDAQEAGVLEGEEMEEVENEDQDRSDEGDPEISSHQEPGDTDPEADSAEEDTQHQEKEEVATDLAESDDTETETTGSDDPGEEADSEEAESDNAETNDTEGDNAGSGDVESDSEAESEPAASETAPDSDDQEEKEADPDSDPS
jgi:small subunit ribosomal protein S1